MARIKYDIDCLNINRRLNDAVDNGQLLASRTPTGFMDALESPENTVNTQIERDYNKRDGKNNTVHLSYMQPPCVTDLGEDECADICDVQGDPTEWLEVDVNADLCVSTAPRSMTWDEMRDWCDSGNVMRDRTLLQDFGVLWDKANRKLIAEYAAGVGGILNGDGATGTQFPLLYTDGSITQVDPEGWMQLRETLQDLNFDDRPIVVGAGNLSRYMDLQNIACCNGFGQDVSGQSDNVMYYRDIAFQNILSGPSLQNPFAVWVPGANVLVDRPKYMEQFEYQSPTMIRTTMVDPITGRTADFEAQFSECDMAWKWHLKYHFGLFMLPLDLFQDCDDGIFNRYKVNYNFLFDAIKRTDA